MRTSEVVLRGPRDARDTRDFNHGAGRLRGRLSRGGQKRKESDAREEVADDVRAVDILPALEAIGEKLLLKRFGGFVTLFDLLRVAGDAAVVDQDVEIACDSCQL